MGKSSKKASGLAKAAGRKLDPSMLPPPPVPVEEEVREAFWMKLRLS